MSTVSYSSRFLNNMILGNGKTLSRFFFSQLLVKQPSTHGRNFILSANRLQAKSTKNAGIPFKSHDENLPLKINNIDDAIWHDSADVVVVGFGGAGAVAAIQARELGAEIIAIDRFGGGGTTAYSGGVVYAGGTRYQRESGYNDTAQEMYKYLDAEGCPVKPETLRRFCEGSNADIEWASSLGVPFGNEKMPNYSSKAKSVPRGHRTAVNGFGGSTYYSKLRDAAQARGVKLLKHTPVLRLVVDSKNQVAGVEVNSLPSKLWKKHLAFYKTVHPWIPFSYVRTNRAMAAAFQMEKSVNGRRFIRARRGVILTTGGFNRNEHLVKKHRPALAKYYDRLLPLGSIGDDGSGLKMGESVGGTTDLMANISVSRTLVPPAAFAHGMLVNQEGKRFVNEAAYAMFIGGAILEQPEGKAYVLMQAKDFWAGVWKSFFPGGTFLLWGAPALMNIFLGGTRRARTLEVLAKKIGVDPAGVRKTATEYNAIANSGEADLLGKEQSLVRPLGSGSFYAVNMSLGNRFAPVQSITMGGLIVDEDTGNVKRGDGGVVEGLYAAGRAAVGICSGGFVSGMALADAIFSGRRAARAAVERDSNNM